ncbi:hypothetical protein HK096_000577 [Nowakowskiella sp. JEL0078]|nr:hypothetical protein HK096_000577 [Nowakowskiella sp. JEL0078]
MAKVPYLSGFGNVLESEALEGALPIGTVTRLPCFCHLTVKFVSVLGQNSPQITPFNLYPEQISGSAFTVPRASNQKSWLYRIRPSVIHSPYKQIKHDGFLSTFSTGPAEKCLSIPNQLRWSPFEFPNIKNEVNFIQGLHTIAGAGDTSAKNGLAIYIYSANQSMKNEAFYNSDGDFLIVPQCGCLNIQTEFGTLEVEPHEIVVIQRGIRFKVELNGPSRGYAVEIFNGHFELPELGPIGANGLANPRDFLHPTAHFEDAENVEFTIYTKFQGQLFSVKQQHSPFDVVAWHGNYVPFKYDLRKFNTVNTVSFDHLVWD